VGFWRWRSFSKVWTVRARPGFAGWIGRPCGTGCIATMMKVWPGCATEPAEEQRVEFAALVEAGPDPALHKVVRWRRVDLRDEIKRRFGVEVHERSVG